MNSGDITYCERIISLEIIRNEIVGIYLCVWCTVSVFVSVFDTVGTSTTINNSKHLYACYGAQAVSYILSCVLLMR